ncbi:MAG: hypothetical protein P8104_13240 [Gammaproteobacteria bacterium]|jgi:hypothetical protein
MNSGIMRFVVIFLFMFTCFKLSGDGGILSIMRFPNTPLMAASTALLLTYLIFDCNPWMIGAVCSFILFANIPTTHTQSALFPGPMIHFTIGITLAILPKIRSHIEQ